MLKIQEAYSNIVEAQTVIAWLNQVITTHYKQVWNIVRVVGIYKRRKKLGHGGTAAPLRTQSLFDTAVLMPLSQPSHLGPSRPKNWRLEGIWCRSFTHKSFPTRQHYDDLHDARLEISKYLFFAVRDFSRSLYKVLTNCSTCIWRSHRCAVHKLWSTQCPVGYRCNCTTRGTYTNAKWTISPTE